MTNWVLGHRAFLVWFVLFVNFDVTQYQWIKLQLIMN